MARKPLLVVGAGFSGAVIARELADHGNHRVVVVDERPHLAGQCHTERDEFTGIMLHQYGPHIFHTDRLEVWRYLDRFGELQPGGLKVRSSIPRGIFSFPLNLHTLCQFFGRRFSPEEARVYLASIVERFSHPPRNFEEQALASVGRQLYEAFFYGYTKKQWGVEPRELPASIMRRLPLRFDFNDSYYHHAYQGIPRVGYTEAVRRMLDHPNIQVQLNTRWEPGAASEFRHTFYTGPLDAYFGYDVGRLGYRTVSWERIDAQGDFQGIQQMNYPDLESAHTRINEHKHFTPWEKHDRTVAFVEYSRATAPGDTPYYPLRLAADRVLFAQYAHRARQQEHITFLGRLATYRYLDMHQVIGEAIDLAHTWLAAEHGGAQPPTFPAGVEC